MKTTEQKTIVAELKKRIAADCSVVDREAAFADMLDESGEVDVCGLSFMPSRIWREMDETAFRCGVNDYADGQEWVEVAGETYRQKDAEEVKETLLDELRDELTEAEKASDDGDGDETAEIQAKIDELENHSF